MCRKEDKKNAMALSKWLLKTSRVKAFIAAIFSSANETIEFPNVAWTFLTKKVWSQRRNAIIRGWRDQEGKLQNQFSIFEPFVIFCSLQVGKNINPKKVLSAAISCSKIFMV